jgi:hypothetical protein
MPTRAETAPASSSDPCDSRARVAGPVTLAATGRSSPSMMLNRRTHSITTGPRPRADTSETPSALKPPLGRGGKPGGHSSAAPRASASHSVPNSATATSAPSEIVSSLTRLATCVGSVSSSRGVSARNSPEATVASGTRSGRKLSSPETALSSSCPGLVTEHVSHTHDRGGWLARRPLTEPAQDLLGRHELRPLFKEAIPGPPTFEPGVALLVAQPFCFSSVDLP